jgi:hypothetical protein
MNVSDHKNSNTSTHIGSTQNETAMPVEVTQNNQSNQDDQKELLLNKGGESVSKHSSASPPETSSWRKWRNATQQVLPIYLATHLAFLILTYLAALFTLDNFSTNSLIPGFCRYRNLAPGIILPLYARGLSCFHRTGGYWQKAKRQSLLSHAITNTALLPPPPIFNRALDSVITKKRHRRQPCLPCLFCGPIRPGLLCLALPLLGHQCPRIPYLLCTSRSLAK